MRHYKYDSQLDTAQYPAIFRMMGYLGIYWDDDVCTGGALQPSELEEVPEDGLDKGGELPSVVHVPDLPDGLGLRGVGVDDVGEGPEPHARLHRNRDLRDHVPGVCGHDRGAEDGVGAFLGVDLDKPFVLAVQDCPVHVLELAHIRVVLDALCLHD